MTGRLKHYSIPSHISTRSTATRAGSTSRATGRTPIGSGVVIGLSRWPAAMPLWRLERRRQLLLYGRTRTRQGALQLKHLRRFFEEVPFPEMHPEDGLTNNGFCLAKPPQYYVFYFPRGGATEIDLAVQKVGSSLSMVRSSFGARGGKARGSRRENRR